MPRGASPKREREYEHLVSSFRSEGRYKGREKEVASRIVNKHRRELGETKDEKAKDRQGESHNDTLPIPGYVHLTIAQVTPKLDKLSRPDLKKIQKWEGSHKNRKGMMAEIERRLN